MVIDAEKIKDKIRYRRYLEEQEIREKREERNSIKEEIKEELRAELIAENKTKAERTYRTDAEICEEMREAKEEKNYTGNYCSVILCSCDKISNKNLEEKIMICERCEKRKNMKDKNWNRINGIEYDGYTKKEVYEAERKRKKRRF